ncbi:hypothetical protein TruAng_008101 [Truncatella angustata]|nr:hypothetical protein TruAng_008101 [Truncatella angustata]
MITANVPCDALITAGLSERVLTAIDPEYGDRISTYWSASAQLRPWCIVKPENTEEVSLALKTLTNANQGAGSWHIAVRGGGHSFWPGANNIENGVTIDLGSLNFSTYDFNTGLASLGLGGSWAAAFSSLADTYHVTVVGGREGHVGIGGFLIGGGNSYYTGKQGFGCDNVINFEVVLANGSVVNANASSNADLHKALKGGTAYDYDLHAEVAPETLVDFASADQSQADDALIVLFVTSGEGITLSTAQVNTQGVTDSSSFAKLAALPPVVDSMTTLSMAELAAGSINPATVWFSLTFAADLDFLKWVTALYETLFANLTTSLSTDDFNAQLLFQPIPSYFGQIGVEKGGNVLGLGILLTSNAVLLLLIIQTEVVSSEAVAHAYGSTFIANVEAAAKKTGNNLPFRFLNYVNPSQDPLSSYGAENVE